MAGAAMGGSSGDRPVRRNTTFRRWGTAAAAASPETTRGGSVNEPPRERRVLPGVTAGR